MRSRISGLVCLVIPLTLAAADPPAAADLVARHVAALGERSAVNRIATQTRNGLWKMGPAQAFPIETLSDRSGRWSMRLTIPGTSIYEQTWNGREAWVRTPEGVQQMPAEDRSTMDLGMSLAAVLHPDQYLPVMKLKGREAASGRDMWVLEAQPEEGKPVEVWFDAASGMLARIGPVNYDDYRDVDGVKWPFRLQWTEGKREQVVEWAQVRHGATLPEQRFDKEASAADYSAALNGMTRDSLARYLEGIDAGAARAVLEQMYNFTAQDGRILYDLVVSKGYKRGIEIGTARGNSGIWLGMAFRKNGGKLVTIEKDAERAGAAKANFARADLDPTIKVVNNDAFEAIPKLEGTFDFVFMDTGAPIHRRLLDLLLPRIQPGGAVTSHNANDVGRTEPEFLKAITTYPNLETKITPTPGGGISVSVKKP